MKLLFSSLVVCLVIGLTPARAELVVNGTFDNDCAGWTFAQTDAFTCSSSEGNPGFAEILNNGPGPVPQGSQTINGLIVGALYELTLDAKSHYNCCNNGSVPGAGVSIDGNQFDFLIVNNQPWTTYTFDFTYQGGSSDLVISAQRNGTDSDGEFDNVSLNQIGEGTPEPASLFLAASGIAILAGSKLRRNPTNRAS